VNFEDNGIMAKESRTVICRCLLEKLGIDDSIWHVYVSNIMKLMSILFYIVHCSIYNLEDVVLKKLKKGWNYKGILYLLISCSAFFEAAKDVQSL
jgi:hypothetical protein